MGSFAITTGTLNVRACPATSKIVEELRALAEGMDEHEVLCEPAGADERGRDMIRIDIRVYGHTSASHSSAIDDKIQELGPHADGAARFHTEWEGGASCFYVGSERAVARAMSTEALQEIEQLAQRLRGDGVNAAIRCIARVTPGHCSNGVT